MDQHGRVYSFFHERWGSKTCDGWRPRSACPSTAPASFTISAAWPCFCSRPDGHGNPAVAVLQALARPGLRERAGDHDGDRFRLAHSLDPRPGARNLLIGVLFLHLLTTYMMRAYRRPREITWMTGVLLLGAFLAFGFSGYLLPWNSWRFSPPGWARRSWAWCRWLAHDLLLLARSGENVTGDTLARFYALHVVILPLLAFALLGMHLFLVQKHGMSIPERDGERSRHARASAVDAVCAAFPPARHGRLVPGPGPAGGALAALFPWELGQKADPFGSAPEGIKPEWYFLFMFQTLKLSSGTYRAVRGRSGGGVVLRRLRPGSAADSLSGSGAAASRLILNVLAALAVAFFIVMTAWGWFSKPERSRAANYPRCFT